MLVVITIMIIIYRLLSLSAGNRANGNGKAAVFCAEIRDARDLTQG